MIRTIRGSVPGTRNTSDSSKFYKAVSALNEQALSNVAHIVQDPPEADKYDTLKKTLIERYTESEVKRIRKLLQGKKLGEHKPTELLREMPEQAGAKFTDDVLKTIWVDAMPDDGWLEQYLITSDEADLEALAAKADVIIDSLAHTVGAVHPRYHVHNEDAVFAALKSIEQRLNALEMDKSKANSRSQRCSRSRSRSGVKSRASSRNKEDTSDTCYYHERFGAKARKCKSPCKFSQHAEN